MMQCIQKTLICLLLGALFCGAAWSMDFAQMSNEELAGLQGAIQNAPEADQSAFQQEWEKRLATMTEEEKKLYAKPEEESSGQEEKLKKPFVMGRGYESQGAGTVIYGGEPVPGTGKGRGGGK